MLFSLSGISSSFIYSTWLTVLCSLSITLTLLLFITFFNFSEIQFIFVIQTREDIVEMSLFGGAATARANSQYLVEFKAGKMFKNANNMVTPDKRKGSIYVYQSGKNRA